MAGFALLVMAAVTSVRIARRRMRYETWWLVHLYTYFGLTLAFAHQITTGVTFVGHPIARFDLDVRVVCRPRDGVLFPSGCRWSRAFVTSSGWSR